VAAALFIVFWLRRAQRPASRPNQPIAQMLAQELERVREQIRLLRTVLWWYLASVAVLNAVIWWANQRAVKTQLLPLEKELEAQLATVTGTGDAAPASR
jgi:hypothetical protein